MSRWPAKKAMQERILDTGGRLFYGQGIRAVGVDTIAAEIGISKRTLYNYFPSKDELIVAYLSRHFIQAKTSDRPLLEQILRYFDWLERWFASGTFRGCPFVNPIAELRDPTHPDAKMALASNQQPRVSWGRDVRQFSRSRNQLENSALPLSGLRSAQQRNTSRSLRPVPFNYTGSLVFQAVRRVRATQILGDRRVDSASPVGVCLAY